jgi:hypothetical protein
MVSDKCSTCVWITVTKYLWLTSRKRKNGGPTTKNKFFQNCRGSTLRVHYTTQTPERRLIVQKQFKTSTHQFSPKFITWAVRPFSNFHYLINKSQFLQNADIYSPFACMSINHQVWDSFTVISDRMHMLTIVRSADHLYWLFRDWGTVTLHTMWSNLRNWSPRQSSCWWKRGDKPLTGNVPSENHNRRSNTIC